MIRKIYLQNFTLFITKISTVKRVYRINSVVKFY